MNIMDGASFFARAKRSLTRDAPIPTYSSTNSLAEQLMKGTSASPATAFAKSVLPVPGRPTCNITRIETKVIPFCTEKTGKSIPYVSRNRILGFKHSYVIKKLMNV